MKKLLSFCFIIIISAVSLSAQEPVVIVEYFGDDLELAVVDAEGYQVEDVYFGMELYPGDKIETFNTTAELRLEPNGTIIKLTSNTDFGVDSLQGTDMTGENGFSLLSGKIRTVASSISGNNYSIRTPSAVCGVRGTDFGMEVLDGARDAVFVKTGAVEFINSATGQSLSVGSGQIADTFLPTFEVSQMNAAQIAVLFEDLDFDVLDPLAVPGGQDEISEIEEEPEAAEQPATTEETEEEEIAEEPVEEDNAFIAWLGEFLGLEFGSVTMDGVTYSKVIIKPELHFGSFKAGFYLPIIYTRDMFDPSDWYRPRGNDEWSFSTDKDWQKDPQAAAQDLLTDIALKIKYVQIGEQRDSFYLKAGNLNNMTTGHGSIMNNYANDTDFPAVRRLGVNMGIDLETTGFEAVVNDVAEPEIFGGRFYLRPAAPTVMAAIGVTGIADWEPAGDIPEDLVNTGSLSYQTARSANPIFTNWGIDLDVPILETDFFTAIAFADAASMVPYIRNKTGSINQGFHLNTFLSGSGTSTKIKNYGIMAGFMGNVSILDYRLEYRNYNGIFKPAFYDGTYDRKRGDYAAELMAYLENPDASKYDITVMGIFGEAGVTLFEKIIFSLGYMWPWEIKADGSLDASDEDFFSAELVLLKGLVPIEPFDGMEASVAYERTYFVPSVMKKSGFENAHPFDANTIFKGMLLYPIAPTLDIATIVTTTVLRNDDGTIAYESTGLPKWAPTVTIETRVHF